MKVRVDKSMGIVTFIPEALTKINPTESLRFSKSDLTESETESETEEC